MNEKYNIIISSLKSPYFDYKTKCFPKVIHLNTNSLNATVTIVFCIKKLYGKPNCFYKHTNNYGKKTIISSLRQ